MKPFIVTAIIQLFAFAGLYAQGTISSLKGATPGASITVKGIVTNGSELGIIRYMQDGTAGIAIYPGSGSVSFNAKRGDSISVTGKVNPFNGLVEINPVTAYTKISGGNTLPGALVITANQLSDANDAELVRVNNVVFNTPGALISAKTTYVYTAAGHTGVIYINAGSPLIGRNLPLVPCNITGLCSTFNNIYQLLPRDSDDIQITAALYFTSNLVQSNITTTSFDVSWNTNAAGSTGIRYGLTPSLELGTLYNHDSVTNHSYSLSSLNSGTPYYVQGFSISGTDTATSNIQTFSTISISSGAIRVYFNRPVDTTVSRGVKAIYVSNIEDTIVSYINNANKSIDVFMYSNNSSKIVAALNSAFTRGLKVRYVADSTTTNSALTSLNPGIKVAVGNVGGIMHNKIMVIDAESATDCWVYGGSLNFTSQNMKGDYNNILFIQDQALARAYTLEFNEMWGDTGATPNLAKKRFGNKKTDNTPHDFYIGGRHVELYFSPSDNTTSHIVKAVSSGSHSVQFAVLDYTRGDISDAMIADYNGGATVDGMIENINDQGSEYDYLLNNHINVTDHCKPYLLHHKYAIMDQANTDSDPTVSTGSHNWSTAAETVNDENEIIIHDSTIANLFFQEFTATFNAIMVPALPPSAKSVTMTIPGALTVVDLLANSTEPNCQRMTVKINGGPYKGTIRNNNDGTVTYSHGNNATGVDTIYYTVCDPGNLCTADTAFLQLPLVGINEASSVLKSMNLYPDPTAGQLTLSLSVNDAAVGNITIMDMTGHKLKEQEVALLSGVNTMVLDISKFSPGIYLLNIHVKDGNITKRFVRQ